MTGKKTKKGYKEVYNEYKPAIWVYIVYGVLIFVLAEGLNWFFGLKSTQEGLIKFLQDYNLDLLFEDAVYAINPDIDIHEVLKAFTSIGKWMWLVSFALVSLIIGLIHANIFRLGFVFRTTFYTCVFILVFKLCSLAFCYGIPQAITGFSVFIKASYPVLLYITGTCFLFFVIGSETAVFWRKNFTEDRSFRE